MRKVRYPIPWCLFNRNPVLSDIWFLKNHLKKDHTKNERIKAASILGYSYYDVISHLNYLTHQGILE